jgi:cyclopropane fatty-acyl-phospholipid synthase-like methyltransferase
MSYEEDYYKTLNYSDYLSRGIRYEKTAEELSSLLKSVGLLHSDSTILDYGCAVGFLTKALSDLGYKAVGFDISEWATTKAKSRGVSIIENPKGSFDCAFYLDVLEHMTDDQILKVFKNVKSKSSIIRIPCSTDGGKTYHLNVSNQDKTHINCKTKEEWKIFFYSLGVKTILHLNTLTVYDTEGVFCALLLP